MMRTTVGLPPLAVLIGLTLGSVFLAENALHVPIGSETAEQGRPGGPRYKTAQVRAADGALLDAWLLHARSTQIDAAVILLHGIGDTRMGVMSQATFLLAAGYTVLAPDSRAHGMSGGKLVTYGPLLESDDVHRWASYVLGVAGFDRIYERRPIDGRRDPDPRVARGQSRASARSSPDCAFASFEEVAYDPVSAEERSPRRGVFVARDPHRDASTRASATASTCTMRRRPKRCATPRVPALLIHGTADTNLRSGTRASYTR